MSRSRLVILLGVGMAIAALWVVKWYTAEPGIVGPVTVSLVTTAVPGNNDPYYPPSHILRTPGWPPKRFYLNRQNRTETFTLGETECTVKLEELAMTFRAGKQTLKTPTQEFTLQQSNPMELAIDNGRKYFLRESVSPSYVIDPETQEKRSATRIELRPAGVQLGKLGKTRIAIFDTNMDGLYTLDDDGIIIDPATDYFGRLTETYRLAQPLSKYIRTPDGLFEIQKLAKDGSTLTLSPYRGFTASLQVNAPQKYSGQIILTSSDANLTILGKAGKWGETIRVIPGDYTILVATFGTREHAMFISGAEMPAVKMAAGEMQILTISGPKQLEFQAAMADGKINIKTFQIKGQLGETYLLDANFSDYKKSPEVYLNVGGKSTLLGKMEYG